MAVRYWTPRFSKAERRGERSCQCRSFELSKLRLPVLTYLSGLTCTWENFTVKAGAQRYAAEHGIIIVAPDR